MFLLNLLASADFFINYLYTHCLGSDFKSNIEQASTGVYYYPFGNAQVTRKLLGSNSMVNHIHSIVFHSRVWSH